MCKTVIFTAFALFVASVRAQAPSVRTGSISVWSGSLIYSYGTDSLKSVDFRNLKYAFGGDTFTLRNGSYSRKYKGNGGIDARLENVWLFDEINGVPKHALVSVDVVTFGGSSSPNGYVLLFEILNGHLVETQEFGYNAQAPGTGASFDTSTGKLMITGRSDDGTPNCCPKKLDVANFLWNASHFEALGYRAEPVREK